MGDAISKPNLSVMLRKQHGISRKEISENAIKVLYRLNKAGYEAYLVGGGVRDLLLGKRPKDFDVTTSATPEQVRKLFHNSRLIGRRFRLAHVMFGTEIIEVSTFCGFRKVKSSDRIFFQREKKGVSSRDNNFASIEEDAQCRDFTINSLYYNIVDFTVRDYFGGVQDLKNGVIRLIGNPEIRYQEDPVRMLRAIRFAAKLNMQVSSETAKPIPSMAMLINDVPSARLFEEALKLLHTGYSYNSYKLLREYHLFHSLFPSIVRHFTKNGDSLMERMIEQVCRKNDACIHQKVLVHPAFLFGSIFWYPLLETAKKIRREGKLVYYDAFSLATNEILEHACQTLAIPKSITSLMRDIWQIQLRIARREGKRAWKLLNHPKFLIAYDFLVLRAEVENNQELQSLVNWWDSFQIASSIKQKYA